MKRKFKHCLFLLTVIFYGCINANASGSNSKILADSLKYVYRTIRQRAADCGNKPDSSCTVAIVKYPEFAKQPVLNDTLRQLIINIITRDKAKEKSVGVAAARFIRGYEADKRKFSANMPYTLDLTATVTRNSRDLVVVKIDKYAYMGGAHGLAYDTFLNWNIKTGKRITLADLFIGNYGQHLNKIAEHIFRRQEKLSDTASLANNYFFFKNKFALNSNFSITTEGLDFLYNEYEIKSYAEGRTRLLVPYSQIKQLLRPNTVLTQFIK